jgi:hypothetical protein
MPGKKKLKKRLKEALRKRDKLQCKAVANEEALREAAFREARMRCLVEGARAFARELNADFGERRMLEWKERFLRETEGHGVL